MRRIRIEEADNGYIVRHEWDTDEGPEYYKRIAPAIRDVILEVVELELGALSTLEEKLDELDYILRELKNGQD